MTVELVLQPEVEIRNGVLERVLRETFFRPKTKEVSKDLRKLYNDNLC
jgi:hypothetical protein